VSYVHGGTKFLILKTIYCISGLGADERVFSKIALPGYVLQPVRWKIPEKNERINEYAQRMLAEIKEEKPILLGLSFGGMMSIEIAKLVEVEKVILISSIKSANELPGWMRFVGKLRLDKMVPLKSFKVMEPVQNYKLGVTNEEERKMAIEYRRSANKKYTNWAINQVLNWKNDWQPPRIYHIHGTKDRMFPIKKITPSYTVKNGGHLMIMNKADEISQYLLSILQ
jgi:pimeloyl-ACP methyl ester carboxylesterase